MSDDERRVIVYWEKPVSFDASKTGDLYTYKEYTYALYMILFERKGTGEQKLEYIGIVKQSYRNLRQRMMEHKRAWVDHYQRNYDVQVRFGFIATEADLSEQLLEDVESALVFGRQPPSNSMKMNSYSLYEDVIVTNVGVRGHKIDESILARTYSTRLQRENGNAGILKKGK